jgi:hypothetical protein
MMTPIRIAIAMMIAWTSLCREYLRKVARMSHPLPISILHRGGLRQEKAYGHSSQADSRESETVYSLRRKSPTIPIKPLQFATTLK